MNFEQICRYIFGIIVGVVLVLNIWSAINSGGFSQRNLIWMIFAIVGCIFGVIGAWKQHFLMTVLCTAIWMILFAFTHFRGIYGASYYYRYRYNVMTTVTVAGAIYSIVLYQNGHKEMGFPKF